MENKNELLVTRNETRAAEPITLRYGISPDAESDPAILYRISTLIGFIEKLARLNDVSVILEPNVAEISFPISFFEINGS